MPTASQGLLFIIYQLLRIIDVIYYVLLIIHHLLFISYYLYIMIWSPGSNISNIESS